MDKTLKKRLFKVGGFIFAVVLIAFLLPSLIGFHFNFDLFVKNQDGHSAFTRSFLFALGSTVVNVILSLLCAIGLSKVRLNSSRGKLLSFLIIPVLLGNMSCAFIGKILFTDSATIQSDPFTKFLTLTLIQFWQYGTLYIYLFWLNIQNIPKLTLNYAQATKMSFVEKVKDIILPACRNLAVLLFILNFIFSIFEDAKIQFIFKSSIGTHTELLSQWLNRTYQSDSLINLGFSNERITQLSFFVLALTFISTIISALIFLFFYKNFVKTKTILRIRRGSINPVIIYIALALFIIVPIFYAVFSTVKDFNFVLGHCIKPISIYDNNCIIIGLFVDVIRYHSKIGMERNIVFIQQPFFILLHISIYFNACTSHFGLYHWIPMAQNHWLSEYINVTDRLDYRPSNPDTASAYQFYHCVPFQNNE